MMLVPFQDCSCMQLPGIHKITFRKLANLSSECSFPRTNGTENVTSSYDRQSEKKPCLLFEKGEGDQVADKW